MGVGIAQTNGGYDSRRFQKLLQQMKGRTRSGA